MFIQLNKCWIIHDVDNFSDHEPKTLDLEFNLNRYEHGARSFIRKPAWHKANNHDFKRNQQKLSENMHNIALPASAMLRRNPL